jgi:hypothetical protein
MIICASVAVVNQLLIAVGGSIAFLGILGEIGFQLDDYTRNPSSSFQQGETESD